MPDQTQEETLIDQVRRRRLEKQSIRDIAKALGVTKYAVEKAVRELDAERRRALSEAAAARRRHAGQTAAGPLPDRADMLPDIEKALPDVAVLLPDSRRTVRQTVQIVQLTRVGRVYRPAFIGETWEETGQNTAGNTQKAPKTVPFVGMYGFMADFRSLLWDMQRLLRQPRIWAHTLKVKHLKKLGDLQARGRTHCLEQGFAYEALLLSEVLGACEDYLKSLLGTVTVNPALLGMDSVRVVQDDALEALIKSALREDSFFAVSGQAA